MANLLTVDNLASSLYYLPGNFAQVQSGYGSGSYNSSTYGCAEGDTACVEAAAAGSSTTTTTSTANSSSLTDTGVSIVLPLVVSVILIVAALALFLRRKA